MKISVMKVNYFCTISFLFLIHFIRIKSDAYRILAVFPLNSKSHENMLSSLAKSLANRGNQVDVITHFKLDNPPKNYRIIVNLAGAKEKFQNNLSFGNISYVQSDLVSIIAKLGGNELCKLLALDEFQKFLKNPPNDPPYDLVITEAIGSNCFIGLGYILKIPVITVATILECSWMSDSIGNPPYTAFALSLLLGKAHISTFWDRLQNSLLFHISKYRFFWLTEEVQTRMMREYLDPNIPNIREIEKNVALIFVNSYHSLYGVRPKTPALIEIAGIHVEQNEATLTPELETWMDESKHGVVYFTLGSMVLIETLPKKTLLAIYASFEKIAPVRVLVRISKKDQLPSGMPSNVLTLPWIPQVPVLSHNNTKLFITHGGLMSIQESLYHGVPMIGIPLFSDQFLNIDILVKKNIAVKIDYSEMMGKAFDEALNEVLHDPKYWESAKRESLLFRDRPMSATDTANFWVEYIIRNGADSLRSPAVDLYWWQVELLDVYGFILICIFIMICTTRLIIKGILSYYTL